MASCGCASATEFYCGPAREAGVEFDNLRSSSVQMAPVALQSVVVGSTMVTVPSPDGWTVISQPTLLGGFSRRALVTSPPVTVKALQRWGVWWKSIRIRRQGRTCMWVRVP